MSKTRFLILGLVLLVGLTAAVPAMAQGVVFNATSLNRSARIEGITETMGEIQLTIAPSGAGTILNNSVINIIYGGTITNAPGANNVTCSFGAGTPPVFPAPTSAQCAARFGVTFAGATLSLNFNLGNQAFIVGDSIVISQVRINVNASGLTNIFASLSGTSPAPSTNPITFNTPSVQVATALKSITATVPSLGPPAVLTCAVPGLPGLPFAISVKELFSAAFASALQETGFSATPAPTVGTLIEVIISGVPSGITITPTSTTGSTASLAFAALPAAQLQPAATPGAALVFTFSFSDVAPPATNLTTIETAVLNFGIGFATPIAKGGLTGPVTAQVRLGPSPTGTPVTGTATTIIRFADNRQPTPAGTVATVSDCVTYLLYPWVVFNPTTTFDTGMVVSNTSSDIFGSTSAPGTTATVPQAGPVTFFCFQSPATPSSTTVATPVVFGSGTTSIGAGQTFAVIGNAVLPAGFAGYCIVKAEFQFAHGFAFLVDGFLLAAPRVAEGYLAMVIPDPAVQASVGATASRSATSDSFHAIAGILSGESLKH